MQAFAAKIGGKHVESESAYFILIVEDDAMISLAVEDAVSDAGLILLQSPVATLPSQSWSRTPVVFQPY
jgi:hypothetical protein